MPTPQNIWPSTAAAMPPTPSHTTHPLPVQNIRRSIAAAMPPPRTPNMFGMPTPKSSRHRWFKAGSKEAMAYPTLNALNFNLMNREDTLAGKNSRINMDGLLRDIYKFKANNDESTDVGSTTGQYKFHVVKMPIAVNDKDYYKKAKHYKWIEEVLNVSLQKTVNEEDVEDSEESHIGDAIRCFLEYIKTNHGDETRSALREVGLAPKQMNEYEIAATIHHTKIGITQWRRLQKSKALQMD